MISTTQSAGDARRLAELARDAGYGGAPDVAVQRHHDVLALIGASVLTPLHADTLRWEGTVLRDRGRTSEAEPLYRRSLEVATLLGYESGVAHAINCLAGLSQRRGDLDATVSRLREAHAIADRCGEHRLVAMIQTNLAVLADMRGDPELAIEHFQIAIDVAEAIGDDQQMERILINYGALLVAQEAYDEAERVLWRGLTMAKTRGDLFYEGVFEENRAEMRLARAELDEAQPSILRALDIAEQRRDDLRKAAALKLRGAYERLCGRAEAAANTLRYALTLAAVSEDALLGAEILYQFGQSLYADNEIALAHEAWRAALDAFQRLRASEWIERTEERFSSGATARYL